MPALISAKTDKRAGKNNVVLTLSRCICFALLLAQILCVSCEITALIYRNEMWGSCADWC